ncbi:MAG: DNA-binding protein, partial [Lachnospiraceae bacterium]|nr:DNA-binding protein [Lachnospiraceae bacterium]
MVSQVIDMDEILAHTLLYDFYGELLTEHQRKIYEDVVFNDLSYSEVAKQEQISRQGVFDLMRRINKILTGYEEKLHLVEQFEKQRKIAAR